MTEAQLQEAVAGYLVNKYPHVLFHSDYGSGIKLTPGQAAMQKRQNGGRRAWPDMFIADLQPVSSECLESEATRAAKREPDAMFGQGYIMRASGGLFLELKKEGTRLKKKNGEWATEHIAEQAKVLDALRERGYCAEFAVGFDEAVRIIDEYLGG